VTREAYTHEVISFGFWPGDDTVGDAAYYSYTAPEPARLRDEPLSVGAWIDLPSGTMAVLPYETVRTARDPRTTLFAFCQSAYEARRRPRRVGRHQLHLDLVPQPKSAPGAAGERHQRLRPNPVGGLPTPHDRGWRGTLPTPR
jgi:hypothetical protein